VPILYTGDKDWYGNLVSQEDGSFLKTSIPLHLEFAKARRTASPDFAQVVRLIKHWTKLQKQANPDFRFKSFMIELIMAKLADEGLGLSDYPEAMQHFFTYVAKSGLRERIAFADFYDLSTIPASSDRVQIIDPVNADNNVARLYTAANADAIIDAAIDAGDAIDAALRSPTKGETVRFWQKVLGPAFLG